MLNLHVDALPDLALPMDLGHLHTHRTLGDIEDDTSAPMVVMVRHALLHRGISLDVHIVASLEVGKVGGQSGQALSLKRLRELVAGAATVTTIDATRITHVWKSTALL